MTDPLARIEATRRRLEVFCADAGEWVSGDGRVAPATVARILGKSVRTLEKWRAEGTGPAHHRIGGRGCAITYSLHQLATWIEEHAAHAGGNIPAPALETPRQPSTARETPCRPD